MLGKGLRRFTFMKSLIYHMKKTSRSQTGSRHLTQSGVKLVLSLLVGDFDRMETLGATDVVPPEGLSLLVGDFDRMETDTFQALLPYSPCPC